MKIELLDEIKPHTDTERLDCIIDGCSVWQDIHNGRAQWIAQFGEFGAKAWTMRDALDIIINAVAEAKRRAH